MFEKAGKFYADWRDKTGARKRKSFTSKRAALKHEEEQRTAAHPRPAPGQQSPRFSAHALAGSHPAQPNSKQQKSSSRLQVVSRRKP